MKEQPTKRSRIAEALRKHPDATATTLTQILGVQVYSSEVGHVRQKLGLGSLALSKATSGSDELDRLRRKNKKLRDAVKLLTLMLTEDE